MAENLDYLNKNPKVGVNNNQPSDIDTSWIGDVNVPIGYKDPTTGQPAQKPSDMPDTSRIGDMSWLQQRVKSGEINPFWPPQQGGQGMPDASWIGDMSKPIGYRNPATWELQQPAKEEKPKPFVFGEEASTRNQQDPEYIMSRNQRISDVITKSRDTANMSDTQLQQMIWDTIQWLGGDLSNPQMQSTIQNISSGIRSQSPQATSDDYFKMLVTNQPIKQTQWPAVQDAYQRFQNFNKLSTFNAQQLVDSINGGELLIGSKARKDLQMSWNPSIQEATKLLSLKNTNNINSYLFNAMNVDANKSLEGQTAEPIQQKNFETMIAQSIFQSMQTNTIGEFRQYVSENQDIVKARDNARNTKTKMDTLNLNIKNLSDDIRAQIVAGGGVATEGYLQALISEKSKPIIREFEKLQAEYNSQTAVLSDLTDNAKQEFQFAQEDRKNKLEWMKFLQSAYEKQEERKSKAQELEYQKQQDERKFGMQEQQFAFDKQKFFQWQQFDLQKIWTQQRFELQKLWIQNQQDMDKLRFQYKNNPEMAMKQLEYNDKLSQKYQSIFKTSSPIGTQQFAWITFPWPAEEIVSGIFNGRNVSLASTAFDAFQKANADFRAKYGQDIKIGGVDTSSMRTPEQQIQIFGQGRTAEEMIAKWVPEELARKYATWIKDKDWKKIYQTTQTLDSFQLTGNAVDLYPKEMNIEDPDTKMSRRLNGKQYSELVKPFLEKYWFENRPFWFGDYVNYEFKGWQAPQWWSSDDIYSQLVTYWMSDKIAENLAKNLYEKWTSLQDVKGSYPSKQDLEYITDQRDNMKRLQWWFQESSWKLSMLQSILNKPNPTGQEVEAAIKSFVSAIDNTAAMWWEVTQMKQAWTSLQSEIADYIAKKWSGSISLQTLNNIRNTVKSFSEWIDSAYYKNWQSVVDNVKTEFGDIQWKKFNVYIPQNIREKYMNQWQDYNTNTTYNVWDMFTKDWQTYVVWPDLNYYPQ